MNTQQIEQAIFELAAQVMSEPQLSGDSETNTLQSIIGMIHTLINQGRILELDQALQQHFPEYYSHDVSEEDAANIPSFHLN